jgi:hypothetical protein
VTLFHPKRIGIKMSSKEMKMSGKISTEPAYYYDPAIGQLYFDLGGDRAAIGDTDLALAWTVDEDGIGCLHKHGRAQAVIDRAEVIRLVDETLQVVTIPWDAIKHPEVGPRILEEINLCMSISGRVSKIEERLQEIGEDVSIEIIPHHSSPGMEM